MNPLRLQASGLGVFDTLDIDLTNRTGTIAVVGPNGAGKSTFLNAIEAALFAAGSRDLARLLGPHADRLEITLTFEHASNIYRTRQGYRTTGGKATVDFERRIPEYKIEEREGTPLLVPVTSDDWEPLGQEDAKATRALIATTIGLTRQTFNASAFLGQGNIGMFAEATAADRKQILGEILDPHDLWPQLASEARVLVKRAESEVSGANAKIGLLTERLEQLPAAEKSVAALTAAKAERAVEVAGAEENHEFFAAEMAGNAAAAERLKAATLARDTAKTAQTKALAEAQAASDAAATLPAARERAKNLNDRASVLTDLEKKQDEQRNLQLAVDAAHRKRDDLFAQATRIETTITQTAREAAELEQKAEKLLADADALEDHDGHDERACDTCGQSLSTTDARAKVVAGYRDQAATAGTVARAKREEAEENTAQVALLKAEATAIAVPALPTGDFTAAIADAREAAAQLPAALLDVTTREAKAADYEVLEIGVDEGTSTLEAAERELARAAEGVKDVATLQRAVDEAKRILNERRAALDIVAGDLVRAETVVEQLVQARVELDEWRSSIAFGQKRLDLLKLAERAYGRDGVPVLVAESALPQIEAEANRILGLMPTQKGETFRVELRTQRELKTSDVLRETLDIIIDGRFGSRAYESFSGGEKGRLSVALRLALSQLLTSRFGADIRLLVLDEVPFLDSLGEDQLVDVIRSVRGSYDRVLTVSHSSLADRFDHVIEFESTADGMSRLVGDREPVAA